MDGTLAGVGLKRMARWLGVCVYAFVAGNDCVNKGVLMFCYPVNSH